WPAHGILPRGSVASQNVQRNEHFSARSVDGNCGQQSGKRVGKAGMMAQRTDIESIGEDLRRDRDEAGGCTLRIGFEIAKATHPLVVEIEPARPEERLPPLSARPIARPP